MTIKPRKPEARMGPAAIARSLSRPFFRCARSCRQPLELVDYLDQDTWSIDHRQVVTPYGVPSEVLVAGRRLAP